jgi:hypothetical protein
VHGTICLTPCSAVRIRIAGHLDTVTKIKQVKDISDGVKKKIVGGNAIYFMGGSLPRGPLR